MALTESTMLDLGSPAPDFSLPDTDGQVVSKADFAGQPLLVMFICNHCPYVKHVAPELARLGDDYQGKAGIVAINANDAENYPEDSPENMKLEKQERGYNFAYLFDETQEVAKAYDAACTPDFFLFDADHRLYYRGQIDDTRPHRIASGNYDQRDGQANGKDLRQAIDALLSGEPAPSPQLPSIGCNIKWK